MNADTMNDYSPPPPGPWRLSRESFIGNMFFLTVPPYDPDSQLDMSSLFRLEAATGMEVITPIVERLGQFNTDFHCKLEAAGMRLKTWGGDQLMALVGRTPPVGLTADKVKKIILLFLETMEPKTWRTLYSILNVLDMEGVVQEIESYLSSKCRALVISCRKGSFQQCMGLTWKQSWLFPVVQTVTGTASL